MIRKNAANGRRGEDASMVGRIVRELLQQADLMQNGVPRESPVRQQFLYPTTPWADRQYHGFCLDFYE